MELGGADAAAGGDLDDVGALPQDLAYLDSGSTGTLNGICLNIVPNELSLGFPAVRFDIWFQ